MDEKKNESNYRPDVTNFDYVWGSDQDQYLKEESPTDETVKQENEQNR
jgi:hypothetical protein